MKITQIQQKDLKKLGELYSQFWGDYSSLEQMTATFLKIKDDPHYIHLGAFLGKEMVGAIAGVICESLYGQCEPYLVLEDFIVDKAHRRKGIGRALITTLEKQAKNWACSQVILLTENNRTDAIGFYTALGFDPATHRGFKKTLV